MKRLLPYIFRTFILVFFVLIGFAQFYTGPTFAAGNSYYVSTTGSDTNLGTLSSPFKTFAKSMTMLTPGDTLYVNGGTFTETLNVTKSGTAGNYITIVNYPGTKPVIDGQTIRDTTTMINAGFVQLDGLHFTNSKSFSLYTVGTHDMVVKNCEASFSHDGGLVFRNGSNVLIDNCNIHHTNQAGLGANHEAVTFDNFNGFEIKNSLVHDGKEEGIDSKYGSKNGKVHHNHVYSNNGPNVYVDSASFVDIYSNEIYSPASIDKPNISIAVESSTNQYTVSNINVYNNIIRTAGTGLSFWVESGATTYARIDTIHIYHNLFYGQSRYALRFSSYLSYVTNASIKNNIFWKNVSNIDTVNSTDTNVNLFDINPKGNGAITAANMFFANENNFDFHLTANSPTINKGLSLGINTDFDNNPRDVSPDIGPFEYGNTIPVATSSPSPLPTSTPTPTPAPIAIKDLINNWLNISPDQNGDQKVNSFDFAQLIKN